MKINDEVSSAVETIRLYSKDVEQTAAKIKTLDEQLKEELESMDEHELVVELEEKLHAARQELKTALLSNGHHNNLSEEKGQLAEKQKDQKNILSDHIVAYYALTQERQIELGPDGDARELLLSGKLGKEQKYQTNIFADQQ